ncbi:hypothetical protein C8R46DRAFT_1276133 [Mycena filopes]|nr:hypothetical protein C8R46DRAFT_1276133 [Mycena filopes]
MNVDELANPGRKRERGRPDVLWPSSDSRARGGWMRALERNSGRVCRERFCCWCLTPESASVAQRDSEILRGGAGGRGALAGAAEGSEGGRRRRVWHGSSQTTGGQWVPGERRDKRAHKTRALGAGFRATERTGKIHLREEPMRRIEMRMNVDSRAGQSFGVFHPVGQRVDVVVVFEGAVTVAQTLEPQGCANLKAAQGCDSSVTLLADFCSSSSPVPVACFCRLLLLPHSPRNEERGQPTEDQDDYCAGVVRLRKVRGWMIECPRGRHEPGPECR